MTLDHKYPCPAIERALSLVVILSVGADFRFLWRASRAPLGDPLSETAEMRVMTAVTQSPQVPLWISIVNTAQHHKMAPES